MNEDSANIVRVYNKGRVTIPKQVRDREGIEDGDYVDLSKVKKVVFREHGK